MVDQNIKQETFKCSIKFTDDSDALYCTLLEVYTECQNRLFTTSRIGILNCPFHKNACYFVWEEALRECQPLQL